MKRILFTLLVSLNFSLAQTAVEITPSTQSHEDFLIQYHIDTTQKLSYEAIRQHNFNKTTPNTFALGSLTHPVWFKISIKNSTDKTQNYVLGLNEVFYDSVELFYDVNGTTIKDKSGISVDLNARTLYNPNAHFLITLPSNQTTHYYIKAHSLFGTFGTFAIYDVRYYHNHAHQTNLFYAFYLGAILIIALYNLFLYFYLKERLYLYYFGYSFSFGVWAGGLFSGLLFYYIPISYNYMLHATTPLATMFLILFSNKVLQVRQKHPRFYLFFVVHSYLLLVSAAAIILIGDFKLSFGFTNVVVSYLFFFYFYLAIKQITQHSEIAKLYLIAIGAFLLTISMLSLMSVGILPNTPWVRYSFLVGSFMEIVLLSLLLAYRINLLQNSYQKTLQEEIALQTSKIKKSNKKLASILEEKDQLLKEMFHRVKNNFQVLVSMLYLQITPKTSTETQNELETVIDKIHAMSIVHTMLHAKDDNQKIEVANYFQTLCKHLVMRQARFNVHAQKFYLPHSVIKNLGLIVNELFINSVKYTPAEKNLIIDITITQEENRVYFDYIDNSDGYTSNHQGYGLKFIRKTLNKLHNVHVTIQTQDSIHYNVEFDINTQSS